MQQRQLYWEDVKVGENLPKIEFSIDARRFYLQISGSQDWYPAHHDAEFAKKAGHDDIFTTTGFIQAALVRLITDWIGDEGWLQKIYFEMRRQNHPGDTVTCQGTITNKYTNEDQSFVECKIWAENSRDGITTPGTALVILPARK